MKSYVTPVIRYTWYAFESMSFIQLNSHYNSIFIFARSTWNKCILYGLILDRVTLKPLA